VYEGEDLLLQVLAFFFESLASAVITDLAAVKISDSSLDLALDWKA
jgi:hypothetical protein